MQDALTVTCPVCGTVFSWMVDLGPGRLESQEPCPGCNRELLFVLEVEGGKVVRLDVLDEAPIDD